MSAHVLGCMLFGESAAWGVSWCLCVAFYFSFVFLCSPLPPPVRPRDRPPVRVLRLRPPHPPDGASAGPGGSYASVALAPAVEVASPQTRSRANGPPIGIELLSNVAAGQQAPTAAASAGGPPRFRDHGLRSSAHGAGEGAGGTRGGGEGGEPAHPHTELGGSGSSDSDGHDSSSHDNDADAADGPAAAVKWEGGNDPEAMAKLVASDAAYAQQLAAQDGGPSCPSTRGRAKAVALVAGGAAAIGGKGGGGEELRFAAQDRRTLPAAQTPSPGGRNAAKRHHAARVADEEYSAGSAHYDSGESESVSNSDGEASVGYRPDIVRVSGRRRSLPRRASSAGRRGSIEGGHEDDEDGGGVGGSSGDKGLRRSHRPAKRPRPRDEPSPPSRVTTRLRRPPPPPPPPQPPPAQSSAERRRLRMVARKQLESGHSPEQPSNANNWAMASDGLGPPATAAECDSDDDGESAGNKESKAVARDMAANVQADASFSPDVDGTGGSGSDAAMSGKGEEEDFIAPRVVGSGGSTASPRVRRSLRRYQQSDGAAALDTPAANDDGGAASGEEDENGAGEDALQMVRRPRRKHPGQAARAIQVEDDEAQVSRRLRSQDASRAAASVRSPPTRVPSRRPSARRERPRRSHRRSSPPAMTSPTDNGRYGSRPGGRRSGKAGGKSGGRRASPPVTSDLVSDASPGSSSSSSEDGVEAEGGPVFVASSSSSSSPSPDSSSDSSSTGAVLADRRGGGSAAAAAARARRSGLRGAAADAATEAGLGLGAGALDFLSRPMGVTGGGVRCPPSSRYARRKERADARASGGNVGGGAADGAAARAGGGKRHPAIEPVAVDPSLDWSSIGGLENHIRSLKEMVFLPLLYPEVFAKFHMTPPKGVLFYGPPGTGKTLCARALAASCGNVRVEGGETGSTSTAAAAAASAATVAAAAVVGGVSGVSTAAPAAAGTGAAAGSLGSTAANLGMTNAANGGGPPPLHASPEANGVLPGTAGPTAGCAVTPLPPSGDGMAMDTRPIGELAAAEAVGADGTVPVATASAPAPDATALPAPNGYLPGTIPDVLGSESLVHSAGLAAAAAHSHILGSSGPQLAGAGGAPPQAAPVGGGGPIAAATAAGTAAAAAAATTAPRARPRVAFFMRNGADCLSKWVGEAERQLRATFAAAEAHQPSIIFFDEIDGLAPVRSSRQDQIHASIVSTLLGLMDGLDARGQIVVIGATNRVDAIDPALRRPGRFDRELVFTLPNLPARRTILGIHTRSWVPPPDPTLLDAVAERAVGYCGADLRALCSEAALRSVRRRYPQIYDSSAKLAINVAALSVRARDFSAAMSTLVPASHRAARTYARPLPPRLAALLARPLEEAVGILRHIFPQGFAAGTLSGTAQAGSGAAGGRSGVVSQLRQRRNCGSGSGGGSGGGSGAGHPSDSGSESTSDDDAGDGYWESDSDGSPAGAASAIAFGGRTPEVDLLDRPTLRPRLLVGGDVGLGQADLGPALLHVLEGCPVHCIDLTSLTSDPSARSGEEALASAVREACRAAPSVLYIPHLELWWETASASLIACLHVTLRDIPASLPLLVLGTTDVPVMNVPEDFRRHFPDLLCLQPPEQDARAAHFEPLLAAAAAVPPSARRRQRRRVRGPPPPLPLAVEPPPPPAVSAAAAAAAATAAVQARRRDDEAALRVLRMEMRTLLERLLSDKKLKPYWRPVDPAVAPDYFDIIKRPVDLSLIAANVDRGRYPTVLAMIADFDQMVRNALKYNPPHTEEGAVLIRRANAIVDIVHAWADSLNPALVERCNAVVAARVAAASATAAAALAAASPTAGEGATNRTGALAQTTSGDGGEAAHPGSSAAGSLAGATGASQPLANGENVPMDIERPSPVAGAVDGSGSGGGNVVGGPGGRVPSLAAGAGSASKATFALVGSGRLSDDEDEEEEEEEVIETGRVVAAGVGGAAATAPSPMNDASAASAAISLPVGAPASTPVVPLANGDADGNNDGVAGGAPPPPLAGIPADPALVDATRARVVAATAGYSVDGLEVLHVKLAVALRRRRHQRRRALVVARLGQLVEESVAAAAASAVAATVEGQPPEAGNLERGTVEVGDVGREGMGEYLVTQTAVTRL